MRARGERNPGGERELLRSVDDERQRPLRLLGEASRKPGCQKRGGGDETGPFPTAPLRTDLVVQDRGRAHLALAFGGELLQLHATQAAPEHRLDGLLALGLVEPLEAVLETGSVETQIGIGPFAAGPALAVQGQRERHAATASRASFRPR